MALGMEHRDFEYRDAWCTWLKSRMPDNPYSVTLYLKQRFRRTTESRLWSLRDEGGKSNIGYRDHTPVTSSVGITPEYVANNFRHFQNVLNRRVFRSKARKQGLHLDCINSVERSNQHRWHHHLIIGRPNNIPDPAFEAMIRESWGKTDWGYNAGKIKPTANDGWVRYITKLKSEHCYIDESYTGRG